MWSRCPLIRRQFLRHGHTVSDCQAADVGADLAAVQLAALGTAASWRLSKWGPLEGYLRVVEDEEQQRVGGGLEATARWEVRG